MNRLAGVSVADRPAVQTQPLTRAQIGEWLGANPRIVRWLEALVRDLTATLPDASESNAQAAEAAQAAADAARVVADEALDMAGSEEVANALIGQVSGLNDRVAAIARSVEDLMCGPLPQGCNGTSAAVIYAPLTTGAEPIELVSDGAGQCVMVPY